MELDLTKLNKPYEIDSDIEIDNNIYQNKDIKELKNLHISGIIYYNAAELLKTDLTLTGDMILKDSVTLEDINYPLDIKIDEEYNINDPYFLEYYKKDQNILDIMAILWENIVLEVPISLTKTQDVNLSGNGWSMGNNDNKEDNIDPRLAKLAELLDERKE